MPALPSLIATWLTPQQAQRITMRTVAVASSWLWRWGIALSDKRLGGSELGQRCASPLATQEECLGPTRFRPLCDRHRGRARGGVDLELGPHAALTVPGRAAEEPVIARRLRFEA